MSSARDQVHTVVLYSERAERRAGVRTAIGRRPSSDLGRINWVEVTSFDEVIAELDRGGVDLAVLDGEAQPTGGMGLARQMKHELGEDCPAVIVVIQRAADRWLATWSLADATLTYPLDPVEAGRVVSEQLRRRAAGLPVLR